MVTESTGVVLYYIYLEVIAIRCFTVSTEMQIKYFLGYSIAYLQWQDKK